MTDKKLLEIKEELDAALANEGPNVGIAFGTSLFDEFRQRALAENYSILALNRDHPPQHKADFFPIMRG